MHPRSDFSSHGHRPGAAGPQERRLLDAALAHGGRLREAAEKYPGAETPWIDLSTGINPSAYPFALPLAALARLPEPADEDALRHAAARLYAAPPDSVAAAPGTQILIGLLPVLFPCRRVAVLGPTYAEHAASWRAAGGETIAIAHPGEVAAMGADAVVLCTPNNPDGRRTSLADIAALAEAVPLVVVDEAFADLDDAPSAASLLPHPGLIVLRSFGKTHGLAGVRLGFALASKQRASRLRAVLGPWAVSGPALAAGLAALPDDAWRAEQRLLRQRDADRLDSLLRKAGLKLLGGTRLFRLASTQDAEADAVHTKLAQAGILTRTFDAHPDWLRFGLPPDEAAWMRLDAALRKP